MIPKPVDAQERPGAMTTTTTQEEGMCTASNDDVVGGVDEDMWDDYELAPDVLAEYSSSSCIRGRSRRRTTSRAWAQNRDRLRRQSREPSGGAEPSAWRGQQTGEAWMPGAVRDNGSLAGVCAATIGCVAPPRVVRPNHQTSTRLSTAGSTMSATSTLRRFTQRSSRAC